MTAKIPARGAILGYVISMIAMTLGIIVLPVAMAPVASAASPCATPSAGTIYHTTGTKKIALTIDDGPSPNWTPQVLSILKSHGVHATFFEIGKNVNANMGLVEQIVAGGNLVGNHTGTHATLTGLSATGQAQEMDAGSRAIENAGGGKPCFFRAPGGNANGTTLSLAHARGMNVVYWSNDTLDWAAPLYRDASYQNKIVSLATSPLYTNPIILMHDGSPGNYRQNSVDSLARVIEFYQARGYTFTDPLGNPFTGDNPLGSVDRVSSPAPGAIRVDGWAFDPNQPSANLNVDIYINGVGTRVATGYPRTDVQAAYPQFNVGRPGFYLIYTAALTGRNHVTVYAINVGPGQHKVLWDGYVNVANPNPIGHSDLASSPAPGQVRVAGWAFDPNSPTLPTAIHVYVNGVGTPKATGGYRPDVKKAYPQAGPNTGYDITVAAPGGRDRVTVYAINDGNGINTVLFDGYVNVANPNPVGHLDTAYGPAMSHQMLRVTGWAFDPNAPTSQIQIHVYVNGVGTPRTTGVARPDVKAAYPQAGANTGFDITVPAPTGSDHVTVYAINVGPGSHTVLWDGHVTIS